jgi:hypothetical protein
VDDEKKEVKKNARATQSGFKYIEKKKETPALSSPVFAFRDVTPSPAPSPP